MKLAPQTLAARLAIVIGKSCATLTPAELLGATGLGFAGRSAECAAFGVPDLGSSADVATCIARHHACRAVQLLELEEPRARELLGLGHGPVL